MVGCFEAPAVVRTEPRLGLGLTIRSARLLRSVRRHGSVPRSICVRVYVLEVVDLATRVRHVPTQTRRTAARLRSQLARACITGTGTGC